MMASRVENCAVHALSTDVIAGPLSHLAAQDAAHHQLGFKSSASLELEFMGTVERAKSANKASNMEYVHKYNKTSFRSALLTPDDIALVTVRGDAGEIVRNISNSTKNHAACASFDRL